MSKQPKTEKRSSDDGEHSFGSGLDEVGWKTRSRTFRLKPRVNNTTDNVSQNYKCALDALIAEGRFGGPSYVSTELETLEEATRYKEGRT